MRHTISLLALLAAGAPTLAAQTVPSAPVVDSASLAMIRGKYMKLFAAGDATGLAALFTADGGIDAFAAPRMRGRAQIEAGLKAGFGMQQPVSLDIVPLRFAPASNSLTAELGTYHETDTVKGKTVHYWGRYVTSAAKDSTGAWKLKYLMAFPDSTKTAK